MKYLHAPIYLIALILLSVGCSSSKATQDGEEGSLVRVQEDLPPVRQARVFLDGRDKGLTPTVLRIDRRFSYGEILLRIGDERVRIYEIEQIRSSNSSELLYSFNAERTDGFYTELNTEDLPKKDSSYVYIPVRPEPLLITDRQYGLQIIVR